MKSEEERPPLAGEEMEEKTAEIQLESQGDVRRTYRNTDSKYLAYQLLREHGMTAEKAAQMLGYKPKTGYHIERKIRERGQKLTLLSESRIRKAHRVVDKLMSGKTFGEIEVVRASDSLRAAEIVLDRSDPKAQDVKSPIYTFTQINVNLARPGHPDCISLPDAPPIDRDLVPITPVSNSDTDEETEDP